MGRVASGRTPGAGDVPLLRSPGLEAAGAAFAAFTTRAGGVSRGAYATLNLSVAAGDDPDAVSENWRRVSGALGVRMEHLVEAAQVHGAAAAVVGPRAAGTVVAGVDALVTDSPDVWLAVYGADCVPLLVVDPNRPAVGALHAGWRGVASGTVRAMLEEMAACFRTDPGRLRAALGPAIGGCCYEVDAPVAHVMDAEAWWPEVAVPTRPGHWRLDLRAAISRQLCAAGVPMDAIEHVGGCTRCAAGQFFSYRRDRVTGRQAGCVRLRG